MILVYRDLLFLPVTQMKARLLIATLARTGFLADAGPAPTYERQAAARDRVGAHSARSR
jgi:hypothetical protein